MSARKFTIAILCTLAGPLLLATSPSPLRFEGEAPADTITEKKPRYSVRKTTAQDTKDLEQKTADLKDPDNLKTEVSYDEKDGTYTVGTTLDLTGGKGSGKGASAQGGAKGNAARSNDKSSTLQGTSQHSATLGTATSYLNAPLLMSPEEYQKWSLRQSMQNYWRQKNQEAFENEGKNKFDFTDMHFDLGPAEKFFGPGGVQIKTQGSAEVKMGANMKKVDNPALPPAAARPSDSTSTRKSTSR